MCHDQPHYQWSDGHEKPIQDIENPEHRDCALIVSLPRDLIVILVSDIGFQFGGAVDRLLHRQCGISTEQDGIHIAGTVGKVPVGIKVLISQRSVVHIQVTLLAGVQPAGHGVHASGRIGEAYHTHGHIKQRSHIHRAVLPGVRQGAEPIRRDRGNSLVARARFGVQGIAALPVGQEAFQGGGAVRRCEYRSNVPTPPAQPDKIGRMQWAAHGVEPPSDARILLPYT